MLKNHFLEEDHAYLCQAESRLGNISLVFIGLNILIACMELTGLYLLIHHQ